MWLLFHVLCAFTLIVRNYCRKIIFRKPQGTRVSKNNKENFLPYLAVSFLFHNKMLKRWINGVRVKAGVFHPLFGENLWISTRFSAFLSTFCQIFVTEGAYLKKLSTFPQPFAFFRSLPYNRRTIFEEFLFRRNFYADSRSRDTDTDGAF